MKAITIKQPWAWLICSGVKDIENRTWKTKFRGRVQIHAAASQRKVEGLLSPERQEYILSKIPNLMPIQDNLVNGALIGSVEIVDCVINHSSVWADKSNGSTKNKPIYNWVLANPITFPEPIPAKGKLSFWDYPNILAETEEEGGELFCHCQIPVKEGNQVMEFMGHYYCRYCGGLWYK